VSGRPLVSVLIRHITWSEGYMEKKRLDEITTLVENYTAKSSNTDNRSFYLSLIQEYGLSDADWEEVMKEYEKRTSKIERKLWLFKYVLDPLLTVLGYLSIVYTSLFLILGLSRVYSLPSDILFPEGTFVERGQLVNNLNLVIIGIGFISLYVLSSRKKNK
jgi:hypothetical protein